MKKRLIHINKYNPEPIVELLQEQYPEELVLAQKLKKCVLGEWLNPAYICFVSNRTQYVSNCIMLYDRENKTIVIDVLEDGEIRGIEFLANLRRLIKNTDREK